MTVFMLCIFIFTFVDEKIIINAESLIILGFLCIFLVIMLNSDSVEQALKGYIQVISDEIAIKFNIIISQILNTNDVLKTSVMGTSCQTSNPTNIVITTNSLYTKVTHEIVIRIKKKSDLNEMLKMRINVRSILVALGLK
jgi:hypothetical protein